MLPRKPLSSQATDAVDDPALPLTLPTEPGLTSVRRVILEVMTTITKRELARQTAAVLARVTDFEDVVVTERGVPRWRIVSARDEESALERLERQGRFTPARSTPAPWPSRPGGPACTSGAADALLDEMRAEH